MNELAGKPLLDFEPRTYQRKLLEALESGVKRAVCVWHRRAGKDTTAWAWLIMEAMLVPGVYYYLTPTYAQGKKILWHGKDWKGRYYTSYVPDVLLAGKHETEMWLKIKCIDPYTGSLTGQESIFQIVGTDSIDTIVGTNPRVCVFSEYALQAPRGWDLIRPILRENGGTAIFLYTPRGRNHGWRLYENAKNEKGWYCDLRTVRDTKRDSLAERGGPVISEEELEEDLRTGMDPDLLQQEYYCSFAGAQEGAYFGYLVEQAHRESRIYSVPWNEKAPVFTAWDIGVDDETAIWFWQHGEHGRVNVIDCVSGRRKSLPEWVNEMYRKPYMYTGWHGFPWDLEMKEWGSGKRRKDVARDLLGRIKITKKMRPEDRIDAARRFFHRCHFHADKCAAGIDALASYRREWDDKNQTFKPTPLHDWACHYADAFQVLAVMHEPERVEPRQVRAVDEFDPFSYERQPTYEYDVGESYFERV